MWHISVPTYKINYVNIYYHATFLYQHATSQRVIYVNMQHYKSPVKIISHVDISKLYVDIIMFHVDINVSCFCLSVGGGGGSVCELLSCI